MIAALRESVNQRRGPDDAFIPPVAHSPGDARGV